MEGTCKGQARDLSLLAGPLAVAPGHRRIHLCSMPTDEKQLLEAR